MVIIPVGTKQYIEIIAEVKMNAASYCHFSIYFNNIRLSISCVILRGQEGFYSHLCSCYPFSMDGKSEATSPN